MDKPKPDLVILPFTAVIRGTSIHLTFDQAIKMLRNGTQVQIERSYPGAPNSIGWTIFRRMPTKYLYENEPLFRFERGARAYIRKAYAIRYSLAGDDDGMTYSHFHL
ncbi:MAG: hypothetical protein DPW18_01530 [Chloroflexi bacterium]|nr:hypothetical protein [Chloroflexota bacterium]MDL1943696.1 hypothetical protein [Chloroflexi bacterium CFX2]